MSAELTPFGCFVAPRQSPQNGLLTIFERWSNWYRMGLTPYKPVQMLRRCKDLRNKGIEGAIPTTGSTPSSTARHHARRRGSRAPAPASWRSGPDSSPTHCYCIHYHCAILYCISVLLLLLYLLLMCNVYCKFAFSLLLYIDLCIVIVIAVLV